MNNYVITGSTGHISKPIIEALVKAGKNVRVVTSTQARSKEIQDLGATPIVGDIRNSGFSKEAFRDADVVYTMIPPIWQTQNWRAAQNEVADSYIEGLKGSSVRYIVNLSSIGAHLPNGVGPVSGLYDFEQKLNKLSGVNVKHLRPSFFFYNFFSQKDLAKQAGLLGGNYGTGEKLFLVHTDDIASAAIEELLSLNFSGSSIRYIIGDERSGHEIAEVIGKAIGKKLNWAEFTDEQQKQGLLQAGLSETHANNYTEMGKALRTGIMQEDARKNKPQFASTKLEKFAEEFAAVFNN